VFTHNHRFQRKDAKFAKIFLKNDTKRLCVLCVFAVSLIVYRKAPGAYNKAG